MKLVRLGYSAVEPNVHIRPHWGPSNAQLKAHLGVVVPTAEDGSFCTTLRVGAEERGWVEGQALLFDDSFLQEARNNCSRRRLVLQAVFSHPGLPAATMEQVAPGKPEL